MFIFRFTMLYFQKNPSPFADLNTKPKTKSVKCSNMNDLTNIEIVECCFTFLRYNVSHFKRLWKWSDFLEKYCNNLEYQRKDMYTLFCNHIIALLSNMTKNQLKSLNEGIPLDIKIKFSLDMRKLKPETVDYGMIEETRLKKCENNFNFQNDFVVSIEGILLPIFNKRDASCIRMGSEDDLIMVESTRMNLRSLAIGVASGRAVCLSGPVGCGKTTLVEYLASKTGRTSASRSNMSEEHNLESVDNLKNVDLFENRKRKFGPEASEENISKNFLPSGFLRIQLGDQIDSKVLLGQYRCTDLPGEFVWQAGILTQAVMNGYWLLLEDLDLCTQDVCMVFMNLLENGYLSVPGFRDCLQIAPGFQLFITLRYDLLHIV